MGKPLFFLGTREWRNRQTRTVQVRVPVMEWGFNSPLAHNETADPSGSAVFVFPGCGGGVVAPVLGYRTLRVAGGVTFRLIGQVVLVFGLSFVATKPKGGGWTRCDLSSWLARSCWFYPGF